MGGAVSAGEDNDELIDNLVEAEYIKTASVERIFRAVDRGDYYLEGCKENAYRDLAWKHGNIHLSAPCIYSEVMESLKLGPGMSFLNLGSGTGYLSTMAGLVLGVYGVNHGVELHSEVVDYARGKLEEFQAMSPALDKYEFCPPSFVIGNCLLLDSTSHQYDRVYCGASCPSEHENYMKNLVRVGGILVMPLNDHLLQVTRTGETTFEVKNVLPVSFASLVPPQLSEVHTFVKLPENNPLKLKEICRSVIRILLRANAEAENPTLRDKKKLVPSKRKKHKRRIRKVVIPVFDDREPNARHENPGNEERTRRLYKDNLMCSIHSKSISECDCANFMSPAEDEKNPSSSLSNRMVTNLDNGKRSSSFEDTSKNPLGSRVRCRRGSIEDPECQKMDKKDLLNVVLDTVISLHSDNGSSSSAVIGEPSSGVTAVTSLEDSSRIPEEANAGKWQKSSDLLFSSAAVSGNIDSGIDNISDESMLEESSTSDPEKVDGESEPMSTSASHIIDLTKSPGGETDRPMTKMSTYLKRSAEENDDEDCDNSQYGETHITAKCCRKAVVFKHIDYSDVDSDDLDDFESDSGKESYPKDYEGTREKSDLSCYTYLMKQKINMLPLPQYLKMYLNFSRPV